MKYQGTTKSLIVYGFIDKDEMTIEHWAGSGSRIIVPESQVNVKSLKICIIFVHIMYSQICINITVFHLVQEAAEAFYSLFQAMLNTNKVAIVRKVYMQNTMPRMGVLIPRQDENDVWVRYVHF